MTGNPMHRRKLITLLGGAAMTWPLAAGAQQRQPAMPVIGYIGSRSAAADAGFVEAFRRGLGDGGYVEGRNVAIEFRWSEGQAHRLPALASDLVRRRVNIIVAAGGGAGPAVKAATSSIPIVFSTGGDPVRLGLVPSLNRPAGNITGVTTMVRELGSKQISLLLDLVPNTTTVGYLIDPDYADADAQITPAQEAVRAFGREFLLLSTRNDREIEAAFATLAQRGSSAFLVAAGGSGVNTRRGYVSALAARHGLPGMYPLREFSVAGGLISYGTSLSASYQQVGVYTSRVLRGAKPADLPVLQPTRFELAINLGTAKALGLTIPAGILAIADEVIE